MKRQLGVFELAATLTDEYAPFNALGVLQLDGTPEPGVLKQSLALLRQRHPLLRARIVKTHWPYEFECDVTEPVSLRILPRSSDTEWMRVVESELVAAFDSDHGPLVRCTCVTNGNRADACELVLSLHHGMADAASAVNLLHELVSACTTPDRGRSMNALTLMPPVERFFPARFKGGQGLLRKMGFMFRMGAAEFSYRWQTGAKSHFTRAPSARPHVLTIELSPAATSALVRETRARRLTVNSALNAALLLAAARHLHADDDIPLCYFAFPNLRPYLKPPVPAEHLGSYSALMRFTLEVAENQPFWEVVRAVGKQVDSSARHGEKFLFAMASPSVIRMMTRIKKFRMGSVALGYMGVPSLERRYGDFSVSGFHAFVSNFDMGPQYTAQAALFNGRLTWDVVYVDSEVDAETAGRMAASIREILESAAQQDGSTAT